MGTFTAKVQSGNLCFLAAGFYKIGILSVVTIVRFFTVLSVLW